MKLDDMDKVPEPRKTGDPGDVRPVRRTEPAAPVHRRGPEDGPPDGDHPHRGRARDGDRLSLHGIPEAELTPAVRAALADLIAEIGRLQGELETVRHQRDYLRGLADQDTQAPVLNRRAFEREIAHAVSLDKSFEGHSTLAVLAVENLHAIETGHGVEARAAVLAHVGALLADGREAGEVVGRLGEGVFGVIMTATEADGAARRTRVLADALDRKAPDYRGRRLAVELGIGLHALAPGERVDSVLQAVDSARRGRSSET